LFPFNECFISVFASPRTDMFVSNAISHSWTRTGGSNEETEWRQARFKDGSPLSSDTVDDMLNVKPASDNSISWCYQDCLTEFDFEPLMILQWNHMNNMSHLRSQCS
jgi:hypothetical protein